MRKKSVDMKERLLSMGSLMLGALTPPTAVIVLAVPAIAALMAWVFLLGNEGHPLSYGAYVVSAYLLVVLCTAAVRGRPAKSASALLRRSGLGTRFMDDADFRRNAALFGSLGVDSVWALANLAFSVVDASVWLITLGVYYLLLVLMRGPIIFQIMRPSLEPARTRHIVRACGIMLIASTFVLSGMVTLIMVKEGGFYYDGWLIYAVAAFAFYSLVSSIVGYVRLRRHVDPLVVVNCRINLAVALVSIFALEIAMFASFGTEKDADLQFVMPIITGAVIAIALVVMGIRSIQEGRKGLSSRVRR